MYIYTFNGLSLIQKSSFSSGIYTFLLYKYGWFYVIFTLLINSTYIFWYLYFWCALVPRAMLQNTWYWTNTSHGIVDVQQRKRRKEDIRETQPRVKLRW